MVVNFWNKWFPPIVSFLLPCPLPECSWACAFIPVVEQRSVRGSRLYSRRSFIDLWAPGHCCPEHWSRGALPGLFRVLRDKEARCSSRYWIPLHLNSGHGSRWPPLEMEINGYLLKQEGLRLQVSGWLKHPAFRITEDATWKEQKFPNAQQSSSSY